VIQKPNSKLHQT